jgi:hypothetical protein
MGQYLRMFYYNRCHGNGVEGRPLWENIYCVCAVITVSWKAVRDFRPYGIIYMYVFYNRLHDNAVEGF